MRQLWWSIRRCIFFPSRKIYIKRTASFFDHFIPGIEITMNFWSEKLASRWYQHLESTITAHLHHSILPHFRTQTRGHVSWLYWFWADKDCVPTWSKSSPGLIKIEVPYIEIANGFRIGNRRLYYTYNSSSVHWRRLFPQRDGGIFCPWAQKAKREIVGAWRLLGPRRECWWALKGGFIYLWETRGKPRDTTYYPLNLALSCLCPNPEIWGKLHHIHFSYKIK